MTTKPLELMSESLQSSVSRICSKHFEFERCLTVIGVICVNVDNSSSDVMIKFNDCITKADLYRMAKEEACEGSELASAAEKIVLSSQLLAALKGLDQQLPQAHQQAPLQPQQPQQQQQNSRKRKRPNPLRRDAAAMTVPPATPNDGDSGQQDDGDVDDEDADEDDEEEEDDPEDRPLQMNLEVGDAGGGGGGAANGGSPEGEVAEELAAIDEIDAAAAAAAAARNDEEEPQEADVSTREYFVEQDPGGTTAAAAAAAAAAVPEHEVITLDDDDDEDNPDEGDDGDADEEADDEDVVEMKVTPVQTIKLTLTGLSSSGSSSQAAQPSGQHHQAASELDLRALNQQLKGALGSKMFKCAYCGKAFSRKFCLERHERLHTGVKPYACQICGERYIRLEDKKRHMRSSHPHDFMNYLDEDEVAESPG